MTEIPAIAFWRDPEPGRGLAPPTHFIHCGESIPSRSRPER